MRAAWLVSLVVATHLLAGCGGPPEDAELPDVEAPTADEVPERLTTRPPGAVIPKINSVSPETVQVSGGHPQLSTLTVDYEISGAQWVKKAYLDIYAPTLGRVQREEITPQEHDTITLLMQTSRMDVGPTLKLRASCPGAMSDWFTFGTDRVDADPASSLPQITSIGPQSIENRPVIVGNEAVIMEGAGQMLTIFGANLTRDCALEATVDQRSVTLHNVLPRGKGFQALINYRDLDDRHVSPRYLEVKLRLEGPHVGKEAIQRVYFTE